MFATGWARGARVYIFKIVLLVIPAACASTAGAAGSLTLEEAERIAQQRDAGITGINAQQDALRDSAVAEAQLPDPMLQVGTMNLPVDTFNFDQEPMTQFLVLGVRQQFLPGKTRELRRTRLEVLADARGFEAEDRARFVRTAVRDSWLQRFYYESSIELLAKQQRLFLQLDESVTAAYAAGRRQQHDVLRVQLEAELLKEREIDLRQEALAWRGELGRWLGTDADRPMPAELPDLPAVPEYQTQLEALSQHPLLSRDQMLVKAGKVSESIARQKYKPAWSIDLRYGFRDGENAAGDDLPDFFSAMVNFSLPLFTGNRQDRRVSAAAAETRSFLNDRSDNERRLQATLERAWARWTKLTAIGEHYIASVMPAAQANVEAVLDAYQNDRAVFDELVRAENTLLDTQLRALRLEVDARIAQAQLLYLAGE